MTNSTRVNELQDKILQAIDIVSGQALNAISYDKTITCVIEDDKDKKEGKYIVSDGSSSFVAYGNDTNLRVGTSIYVMVPEGKFENQKLIVGKKTSEIEEPFLFTRPLDTIFPMEIKKFSQKVSLVANAKDFANNDLYPNIQGNYSYEKQYIGTIRGSYTNYTRLGIKAEFSSQLKNVVSGNYGLLLLVTTENMKTTREQENNIERDDLVSTYDLWFDCQDMFGDPYNFQTWYEQQIVFPLENINGLIKEIQIYFYQLSNFKNQYLHDVNYTEQGISSGEKKYIRYSNSANYDEGEEEYISDGITYSVPYNYEVETDVIKYDKYIVDDKVLKPNLFVQNIEVQFGYDISSFDKDYVEIYTENGFGYKRSTSIKDDNKEKNQKMINMRWVHIDENKVPINMITSSENAEVALANFSLQRTVEEIFKVDMGNVSVTSQIQPLGSYGIQIFVKKEYVDEYFNNALEVILSDLIFHHEDHGILRTNKDVEITIPRSYFNFRNSHINNNGEQYNIYYCNPNDIDDISFKNIIEDFKNELGLETAKEVYSQITAVSGKVSCKVKMSEFFDQVSYSYLGFTKQENEEAKTVTFGVHGEVETFICDNLDNYLLLSPSNRKYKIDNIYVDENGKSFIQIKQSIENDYIYTINDFKECQTDFFVNLINRQYANDYIENGKVSGIYKIGTTNNENGILNNSSLFRINVLDINEKFFQEADEVIIQIGYEDFEALVEISVSKNLFAFEKIIEGSNTRIYACDTELLDFSEVIAYFGEECFNNKEPKKDTLVWAKINEEEIPKEDDEEIFPSVPEPPQDEEDLWEPEQDYQVRWYRYVIGAAASDEYCGVYWERLYVDKLDNIVTLRSPTEQEKQKKQYGLKTQLTNIFFNPDVSCQIEKIKAIIIYNNNLPYYSNELVFENEEELPPSKEAWHIMNALNIVCDDGTNGNYMVYGQGCEVKDISFSEQIRTLSCWFDTDSIGEYTSKVTDLSALAWYIPAKNTMITLKNTGYNCTKILNDEGEVVTYKLINEQPKYTISKRYNSNNSNNTILCSYQLNGIVYSTEFTLTFGKMGTMGSDQTLVIDFANDQNCYTVGEEKVTFQVQLYDEFGVQQDISDTEVIWDFPWQKTFSPIKKKGSTITFSNVSWQVSNLQIISATIGDLTTYFIIPIRPAYSNVRYIQGATEVIYQSDGVANYSAQPYKAYDINNREIENLKWQVFTNDNSENSEAYIAELKSRNGEVVLNPLGIYIEDAPLYGIYAMDATTNKIVWSQAILVCKNKYPSTVINKWDGKSLQLNQSEGYILTAAIAAGSKNNDNTFSGVVLGDWSALDSEESISKTGVYGFDHGEMSYAFKEDGTAFIGVDGKGRINFDGNKATIYSPNYEAHGMLIDLDAPYILMRDLETDTMVSTTQYPFQIGTKFKVKWDGTLESNNGSFSGTIISNEGSIGGWHISSQGIMNSLAVKGSNGFKTGALALYSNIDYDWYGEKVEDGAQIVMGSQTALFGRNIGLDGSIIIYDQNETSYSDVGTYFNNPLGKIGYLASTLPGGSNAGGLGVMGSYKYDEYGLLVSSDNVGLFFRYNNDEKEKTGKKYQTYITLNNERELEIASDEQVIIQAPSVNILDANGKTKIALNNNKIVFNCDVSFEGDVEGIEDKIQIERKENK